MCIHMCMCVLEREQVVFVRGEWFLCKCFLFKCSDHVERDKHLKSDAVVVCS
jgi:hypothetical protein